MIRTSATSVALLGSNCIFSGFGLGLGGDDDDDDDDDYIGKKVQITKESLQQQQQNAPLFSSFSFSYFLTSLTLSEASVFAISEF